MRFLYPDAPGVRPYVFIRLMDWYFWIYDGEGMSDKKGQFNPSMQRYIFLLNAQSLAFLFL